MHRTSLVLERIWKHGQPSEVRQALLDHRAAGHPDLREIARRVGQEAPGAPDALTPVLLAEWGAGLRLVPAQLVTERLARQVRGTSPRVDDLLDALHLCVQLPLPKQRRSA